MGNQWLCNLTNTGLGKETLLPRRISTASAGSWMISSSAINISKEIYGAGAKALIDYENSNEALDEARLKSKDVKLAEAHQQECCQKFEQLSKSAKEELINFKRKRVAAFRKNLIEMSELEIRHARNNVSFLQSCIDLFKNN
ncbi:sorting nexin-5-like [Symphalangus syndactylus]|uniref:sorting nexin-5-like n=1 Tax=Symphalangus syndactylus TaxID=9590 RepID=UPI0030050521